MYADQLYTPNKYRGSQYDTRKDKSMTFSQLKSHKSTEADTHSPYRSSNVSKLEEARKNIDSVICDMEDLRDVNQSAFREVKSVNSDVLD